MSSQINPITPVALVSASFLSGMIASISIISMPALNYGPIEITSKIWQTIYHRGRAMAPPFAITSATSFAYLAYQLRSNPGRFAIPPSALYGAAALLTPCIVPFTVIFMGDTLVKLEAKADGKADAPSEAETKALMKKWTGQNLVRAGIVGVGAVLGCVATLAL